MLETIGAILAIVISVITIMTVVYHAGQLHQRLNVVEDRMKEDRNNNGEAHKNYDQMALAIVEITTMVKNLDERMTTIEADTKEVLARLPARRSTK